MKYAGYIGTALSLGIAGIIQMQPLDEFVKFVSWTVPCVVAVIGWTFQLLMTWRKVKKSIVNEVTEQVVDEMWKRIDTFSKIKKRIEEHEEPTQAA